MPIHPTAIVDRRATIDASADIGPFVVIEGPVDIGPRTRVHAHAVLIGRMIIGADNVVHAGAVLGDVPQDKSWTDQDCGLRIGERNVFRELSQVHRATKAHAETVIGSDNYFMTCAHIAHDCRIGNDVILATGATLGGHVEIADQVFISGNCVVHQFARIGRLAFLRGLTRTSRDIPPFCIIDGLHTVRALNRVGLRRAGFTAAQIRALQRAFVRLFFSRRNLRHAMAELETEPCTPEVEHLLAFIRASKRGVAFGPRHRGSSEDD